MSEKIVVSRQWNNPQIRAFMNASEVGAEMDLQLFLGTLVEVMGNPTMLVTKAQLLSKLNDASEQILIEMKKATVHV